MQGGNTFSLGEGCPGVTLGGDMGWEGSRGVGKGGGSCEECVGQSEQWNWQGAHTIQPSSLVFQTHSETFSWVFNEMVRNCFSDR